MKRWVVFSRPYRPLNAGGVHQDAEIDPAPRMQQFAAGPPLPDAAFCRKGNSLHFLVNDRPHLGQIRQHLQQLKLKGKSLLAFTTLPAIIKNTKKIHLDGQVCLKVSPAAQTENPYESFGPFVGRFLKFELDNSDSEPGDLQIEFQNFQTSSEDTFPIYWEPRLDENTDSLNTNLIKNFKETGLREWCLPGWRETPNLFYFQPACLSFRAQWRKSIAESKDEPLAFTLWRLTDAFCVRELLCSGASIGIVGYPSHFGPNAPKTHLQLFVPDKGQEIDRQWLSFFNDWAKDQGAPTKQIFDAWWGDVCATAKDARITWDTSNKAQPDWEGDAVNYLGDPPLTNSPVLEEFLNNVNFLETLTTKFPELTSDRLHRNLTSFRRIAFDLPVPKQSRTEIVVSGQEWFYPWARGKTQCATTQRKKFFTRNRWNYDNEEDRIIHLAENDRELQLTALALPSNSQIVLKKTGTLDDSSTGLDNGTTLG